MTFDELQKTWQSPDSNPSLTINSEILLREVRSNKEHFQSTVFWRDIREGGIAFVLFIFFLYHGLKMNVWSLVLLALSCLFITVFLVVDRVSQIRKAPSHNETLTNCIESSLFQVEHQIWLLKNVFWWYLLPFLLGMVVFWGQIAWNMRSAGPDFWWSHLKGISIGVLICWGVYHLNQWAVRKFLQPRREEIQEMLSQLKDSDQ